MTILYAEKQGNLLMGVTRGFQGVAKAWGNGTPIARRMTAYDHEAFRENIEGNWAEIGERAPIVNPTFDNINGLPFIAISGYGFPLDVTLFTGVTIATMGNKRPQIP